MRTYPECVPCFLRQALEAAKTAGCDATTQEEILQRVAAEISRFDLADSPPAMGQRIHRIVRELSGVTDPYQEAKSRFNKLMMQLLPRLRDRVAASDDALGSALALAAAANVIDFSTSSNLAQIDVESQLEEALSTQPSTDQVARFERAVATSARLLYIADNAGEIVLDRLLIEHLVAQWDPVIILAVRGGPVINDALRRDAQEVGLDTFAQIVENGSDVPGTC